MKIRLKDTNTEETKYANILLDTTRISILEAIATNPDSDAYNIIKKTGIPIGSVYRELKTLRDAAIITKTEVHVKIGPRKKLYRMNRDSISFRIDRNGTKVSII